MSSEIDTNIPFCGCQQKYKLPIIIFGTLGILSLIFNAILITVCCINSSNRENCIQHLNQTSNDSEILPNTSESMYSSNYHSFERTLELLELNKCSKPIDQFIKVSEIYDFGGRFHSPKFIVVKKCNENIQSYCGNDSGNSRCDSKCLPVEEKNVLKTHEIKVYDEISRDLIMKNITYIDNYECKCQ